MRPPANKFRNMRYFNLKEEMKRVCSLHTITDSALRRRLRTVLDRKDKTEKVIKSGDTQILDISFIDKNDYYELLEALRWQEILLQTEIDRRTLSCDEKYDWDTPSDTTVEQPFDLLNVKLCTCADCDFDLLDTLNSSVLCASEEVCTNSRHCTCFDCVFSLQNDPVPSINTCTLQNL